MKIRSAFIVAAGLLLPGAAHAQTVGAQPPGPCITPPSLQMQADKAAYDEAMIAFRTRGFAALRERRAALETALAHAPPGLGPVEDCGAQLVIHPSSPTQSLLWLMMAANEAKKTGDTRRVVATGVPIYVYIALILGSLQNEEHHYDAAATVLRQALVWQPREPLITGEAASALTLAKRYAEALALCDATLDGLVADDKLKALLQRRRGFALVELRRLDEAEAAYRLAIGLDATDQVAPRELAYVQQQKGGAAPRTAILTAPHAPPPSNP